MGIKRKSNTSFTDNEKEPNIVPLDETSQKYLNTKEYIINIHSPIIAFISFIVLFTATVVFLPFLQEIIENAIFVSIMIGAFLGIVPLTSILSKARVKIILTDKTYIHIWLKKFLFSKEKDIKLNWTEILDYYHWKETNPHTFVLYDGFQLTLRNNKRYKIIRLDCIPQNDDFDRFIVQFPLYLSLHNEVHRHKIIKGKDPFEKPFYEWIMIILTILIILQIIYLIIKSDNFSFWIVTIFLAVTIATYWVWDWYGNK